MSKESIPALDLLRGIAIAGILIMNIQSFSMPSAAYVNPTAYGDLEGLNRWTWIMSHLVASGKFLSIFSILFGAGVLIFIRNAEGRGENPAGLHFRRMTWLFLFGMLHAYLLWSGDILVVYSLCGLMLWFFRSMNAARLLQISFVLFLVPLVMGALWAFTLPYWPEEMTESMRMHWSPDPDHISMQVSGMRGSWFQQLKTRAPETLAMQTGILITDTSWRVLSMMLLGRFLLKRGILTAKRTKGFYLRMSSFGLITGYLLSVTGIALNFRKEWSLEYSMFLGGQFNYLGSVFVALGYIGLVMMLIKSGRFQRFVRAFSGIGRTAFSNYILQTLICTTLFYGHGMGLFGSIERKYQLIIVFAVWLLQLILTTLWLKVFRQGPLEWVWRCLTYRQCPPLLLSKLKYKV